MPSLKYFNQDKDDIIAKVFSELKILGVKVPKIKKFKTNTGKQEKYTQDTRCKIFGVNLSDQEWISDGETSVPKFIAMATTYLRKFSKKEVGLFRKGGNVARQKKLRLQLENGGSLEDSEPNDVACLLKQWLREMPDPLIPLTLQDVFIRCLNLDIEENCVTACLLTCLLLLPDHLNTLKHILCFLKDIAADSDRNKMSVYNLSLIMAPNIFVAYEHSNKIRNNSVQQHTTIVKILIDNADGIGEIPAGIVFQYSFLGSELDSSSDLLDCNANKSKKKRKSGGPVQDIFSGFRKLVGQNGTPGIAKTPEYELKIPAFPRSAPKRKADPDHQSLSAVKKQAVSLDALDSPSLVVTPKQKGLFHSNAEKDSNRHVRRKSIGALLRRKDRKRNKSSKLPQSDICINSSDNYTDENSEKLDVKTAEHLFEKCSPLNQQTKSLSYSGSIKKSVSDCYLPMVKTEFSMLPIISVSSSQGCLPNRPIRTSQYNLRSETLNKSLLGEIDLLDEKTKSENEENQEKKSLQKDYNIQKEVYINTVTKHESFETDCFSIDDIPHIDSAPQSTHTVDNCKDCSSRKEIYCDSFEQVTNARRTSLRLSGNTITNVKCTKAMNCEEFTTNFNPITVASKNFKNLSAESTLAEGITLNKLGLTRQDGFIVKNKSKSSTSQEKSRNHAEGSRSTIIGKNKGSQNENTNADKQKLINGYRSDKNSTSERKSLKRKTRHGSLIRGRPNSVKSGLRSETPHRYSNDSALMLKSSPNLYNDLYTLTSEEKDDKNSIIESPQVLSLDLSLSIILQNFCISSPINSPEISLDVDITSKENNSSVKLNMSNNEKNNSGDICDPICVKSKETTPDLRNRKRLSNNSEGKVHNLKKRPSGNRTSSPHSTSGGKRKNSKTKRSSAHSLESFCTEMQNSINSKENQVVPFDDNCFKTPNNKVCSPDSVTWVSGSSFLSSISSPQDEVTNKRESIAMILKNNTGHVQAKVNLYDNQLQNTSVSSSTKRQSSKDRVLRSSSQKCYSGSRMKVSTSMSCDSATRSNSVKNKLKHQRSPLPPIPKFTLTDLCTPSPKTSQPLKEVTNLNIGLDDVKLIISPNKVVKGNTPMKQKISPPQFKKSTPNSGSRTKKRNSFSGYTPYRMSKKVSRSESSPACRRKEIIIYD